MQFSSWLLKFHEKQNDRLKSFPYTSSNTLENHSSVIKQNYIASNRPRRNVGSYKNGRSISQWLPIDGETCNFTFHNNILSEWEHPVPVVANRGQVTGYHQQQKLEQSFLAEICCKTPGSRIPHTWLGCLTTDVGYLWLRLRWILFQWNFWSTLTCSTSQDIQIQWR